MSEKHRVPTTLVSAALVVSLLVGSCGSDAAVAADDATSPETAADATTTTTMAEATTTTAAETTVTTEEATTTTVGSVIGEPDDGVLYTDTEGLYSLLIDPDWGNESSDFPEGFVGWFTGQSPNGFGENVLVRTSDLPGNPPFADVFAGITAQLESSYDGFDLIDSEIVTRPDQPDIGVLEFNATVDGAALRFLQVYGIWDDVLVILTGSTDASAVFDDIRPYALTLSPVS